MDAREDAPRQNVPYDDDSHGTHTTGTVLGDDGDPGTNQIGVALTQSGSPPRSSPTAAPRATKRLPKPKTHARALGPQPAEPRSSKRPHVINNSWGDLGVLELR